LEGKERDLYEKKRKLRKALQGVLKFGSPYIYIEGKPIPTELRKEEVGLREDMEFDDAETESK
jgi:U3 small nucleolar ribonucleoprotein protein IMP4